MNIDELKELDDVSVIDPEEQRALSIIRSFPADMEQVRDIFEAKEYISLAKSAALFFTAQGLEENAQVAREASLWGQRKAGEFLKEMPKNTGVRMDGRDEFGSSIVQPPKDVPTLADLDIDKHESHRWQLLADVPDETFQEYIDTKVAKGHELTTGGLIKIAKSLRIQKERQAVADSGALLEKQNSKFRLIHGDFCQEMQTLEAGSVDVIITDPPYPREYLWVYEELSREAARLLKPGGSLLVMVGQSYLPEILPAMAKHLTYQWTLAYLTPGGQSVQLWQRKVNTFWKPFLWFVKGEHAGNWIGDVCKSPVNNNDKRFHDWGQSESGMMDVIERFTYPGQLILDPFCGAGTTGVVALSLGRRFIGIDNDRRAIEITAGRIHDAAAQY